MSDKISRFWQEFKPGNVLPFLSFTFLLSLIVCPQTIYSQSINESGLPLIRSFSPEEYLAHGQNWAITQDNRGVMYFGNTLGVVEYDGSSWRLLPFSSIVRSIDTDDRGVVYVGAQGDFGYLEPDSTGTNQFISFTGMLSENDRRFTNVWKTYATKDGVYFNAMSHLFRWKDDTINIWYPGDNPFGWSFMVRDTLYIQKRGIGIYKMVGDSLQLLPGSEEVARVTIFSILPFGESELLIGTRARGLEIYRNGEVTGFETEIDPFLQENGIYSALILSDGSIAIGTTGGLIIISEEGRFIKVITDAEGLFDRAVLSLFSDRQDQVWAGLQNGISRIDWPSPVTFFGPESGIEGHLEVVLRYNDTVFVTGRTGLFCLHPYRNVEGHIGNARFNPVPGFEGLQSIALISFHGRLVVGTHNGVYEYDHGRVTHLGYEQTHITSFTRSKKDPARLFASGTDALMSFRLEDDHWTDEGKAEGFTGDIERILEQSDGKVWLGTRYGGPIRVDFSNGFTTEPVIEQFDAGSGIIGADVFPFSVADRIVFGTDSGLFRFDDFTERFLPDSTFGELFAGRPNGNEVFRMAETSSGDVWIISSASHFGLNVLQEDGSFRLQTEPYAKINPYVYSILAENNGVTWFVGDEGIYRFDQSVHKNYQTEYYSLVRSVLVNSDSLIYNGNSPFNVTTGKTTIVIPVLDSRHNGLRFEYSATDFVDESMVQFQYFLDGYDKKWSSWSTDTRKEYTNLPGGDYTFRVRARNIYGTISQEGTYAFKVLPPWWNTWLARTGYFFIALIFVWGILRWRTAKLKQRQKELEMEIAAATREIRNQKEEVESQRDEIEAQRDEIKTQRDQLEIERDRSVRQKNEILDSINYAQRIQAAMLPPEPLFNELLDEVFILYKPRDIVSGDFYWIKQVNNYTIVAAADCTGHGVPGAFMSLLGISFLNEIVQRREITQANQVLNELRSQIKHSLRQHGLPDESKDGIDMALCAIDRKNNMMQYAGANNPMYLIKDRDGVPVLNEIKADRMPLGYYSGKDKAFTNHEIKLEIGDSFYLFSDGFIDQKGGKDNRKFMSRNLKKVLLEINDQPMYDQKQHLERILRDWMDGRKQMDDILILGIRV